MVFLSEIISVVTNFLVIFLPWFLIMLAGQTWLKYRRLKFQYFDTKHILLEIKLPPEVLKSPRAMEIIFSALYAKTDGTYLEVFKDGKTRPHFSVELVSQGGNVRFFIWAQSKYQKIINNQFYSQYPGVEIVEAEDYTRKIVYNPDRRFMWGTYFILSDKKPKPLVTYKNYELDRNPDEEVKIDPFTSVIEYLGGLAYGEEAWMQIVFRANSDMDWKSGNVWPFQKTKKHQDNIKSYIDELKEKDTTKRQHEQYGEYETVNYSPGVVDEIKQLRELQDKFAFDIFMRGIYISKPETFNGANISGLIGTVVQFSHAGANGLRLKAYTDITDNKKDLARAIPFFNRFFSKEKELMMKEHLAAYKRRGGFLPPHKGHREQKPFTLSTEEMATIYHLPGSVVTTPTLIRVDARKAEPPGNLPV